MHEYKLSIGYGTDNQNALDVSMINLIATPEKYNGKLVRVNGVGRFAFEAYSIFLSKDDYMYDNSRNALWLSYDYKKLKTEDLKEMNGDYVCIEGIFSSKKGEFYSGTINDVSRYYDISYTRLNYKIEDLIEQIAINAPNLAMNSIKFLLFIFY